MSKYCYLCGKWKSKTEKICSACQNYIKQLTDRGISESDARKRVYRVYHRKITVWGHFGNKNK